MKVKVLCWLSVALLASLTTLIGVQGQSAELIAFWDFEQIDSDGETIRSYDGQWAGIITGDAVLTEIGGGRPNGGGRGFDVSEANPGHLVLMAEGDDNPLNLAAVNDQVSIVIWQKNFSNRNSSSFWSVSEDADRHIQFHVPWGNGTIFFDTMGCCVAPTQRLSSAPSADHVWEEEWHHYAFVKDGPNKKIYIDGEVLIEQEGSLPLSTLVTEIHIGAQATGGTPDGIIDDVAIFKGALTQEEIQAFVAGDSPGVPPADTDGDGIPDRWEDQWGFDPNDPADAKLDPDEDGDDNLAEFSKGTDPLDMTDPFLMAATTDCSMTNITLTFSETLDETVATDAANYSISPSLDITDISVKRNVVTLRTSQQDQASSYTVTANNLVDLSKNTIPADSSGTVYTCIEITEGVLRFSAWFDITGTSVGGLVDDPRFPDEPDLVGPVFSFDSRDIFPNDTNDNFGAVIEGWLTPEESGDYHFFLRSDDASELWISTDDSPGNLAFQAEQTGCCNPFLEVGADQTTFSAISLMAGQKYFIQVIYKEGGGGDYAQVAWRKEGDSTPAGSLLPIPGRFLSSPTALLAPAEGSFVNRTPASSAQNVLPNTSISITHRNGAAEWTADNTSLAVNGTLVESQFENIGGVATLSYTPPAILSSGQEVSISLTFPDPGGSPTTEEWAFTVIEYGGPAVDSVGSYPGLITGNAVFTEDGGGRSGNTGDFGMDFTQGGSVIVTEFDFLNDAFANDELTVVYWGKKHTVSNSSAFWIASASASGTNRGFHAHVPWSDQQIYFDTAGCCASPAQRINAPIQDLLDFEDGFPTDEWHLYSFSKKGDVKEIRIDGELFLEGIDSDPLVADVTGLYIGSANDLGNSDRSVFDDFSIFSTALSESDLKSIADGAAPSSLPASKGLIAYWDFNTVTLGGGGITGFSHNADGSITIEFTGVLQSSDTIDGDYAPVDGASSPFTVTPTDALQFYIAR
ncbi:MAG: hypothetical protein M2R45_04937 [Verrucomicrobia subdivision 3 bacterium]|nr:hypothetical protein [Limisphaerales bacterium]MCS1415626.1 hypothetical protein [Limisphaerales bacterium]